MVTIKLPYTSDQNCQHFLLKLRKQQSICIRSAYNRFKEGASKKEAEAHIKQLNSVSDLDSWLIRSAMEKGSQKFNNNPNGIIFGGKKNWIDYNTGKITKEEFKKRKISNLYSVGEANACGNRKFRIHLVESKNEIIFQPDRYNKFILTLPTKLTKSYKEQLLYLQEKQNYKEIPITYELNDSYIFITFTPEKKILTDLKDNRIFSIDMNPNNLGFSVLDFDKYDSFKIIHNGIIDNSKLNENIKSVSFDHPKKNYQTNKRKHECFQIVKYLINLAKHYKCKKFVIEDLEIGAKKHNKGKNFNRLINNNWNRTIFISNLKKKLEIYGIELVEVSPIYSSFVGNLAYQEYPDPICSAIEIGRRGYKKFVKGWFYPKLIAHKKLPKQWKQEVDSSYQSWVELYNRAKKAELKYHFSGKSDEDFNVFSLTSRKSCVKIRELKESQSKLKEQIF